MRFYLLSCLLFYCLQAFAQSVEVPPVKRSSAPHEYRVGVSFVMDRRPVPSFVAFRGVPVGVPDRGLVVALNVERRLVTLNPTVLMMARVSMSYQQMNFSGRWERYDRSAFRPIVLSAFREEIEYEAWQFSVGLGLEPVAGSKFAPYLALDALLALPTYLDYDYVNEVSGSDFPGHRTIQGGALPSPGWSMAAGVRILPGRRICLKIGGHLTDQVIRTDWPPVLGRDLTAAVMAVRKIGWRATVLYGW